KNLQYSIAFRSDPCKLKIQLGKKFLYVNICIKSHDGKSGAKKRKKTYKPCFYIFSPFPRGGLLPVSNHNIGFSYMCHIQAFFFSGNDFYQIQRRDHISSWF